mmetsp:Transcript_92463/g.260705  ORF Transcript_92463/g.260705 Transcript_92463/m.260705 type:complete len:222 (-) Transcript_92463:340-1005(-)
MQRRSSPGLLERRRCADTTAMQSSSREATAPSSQPSDEGRPGRDEGLGSRGKANLMEKEPWACWSAPPSQLAPTFSQHHCLSPMVQAFASWQSKRFPGTIFESVPHPRPACTQHQAICLEDHGTAASSEEQSKTGAETSAPTANIRSGVVVIHPRPSISQHQLVLAGVHAQTVPMWQSKSISRVVVGSQRTPCVEQHHCFSASSMSVRSATHVSPDGRSHP